MITALESDRLNLRQFCQDDFEFFADVVGGKTAKERRGVAMSEKDAWELLALVIGHWQLRGYGLFALEEKTTNDLVGWAGPWFPMGFPVPELSWALSADGSGKGYATEAARRIRLHLYKDLDWATVISFIASDNLPSQRVAMRLGAVSERTFDWLGRETQVFRHPSLMEILKN